MKSNKAVKGQTFVSNLLLELFIEFVITIFAIVLELNYAAGLVTHVWFIFTRLRQKEGNVFGFLYVYGYVLSMSISLARLYPTAPKAG